MIKAIFKTGSTAVIILFAAILFFGCGKKESTDSGNDKQQTTQDHEMGSMDNKTDQNSDQKTDKNTGQDMQKSGDKNTEHATVKLPTMQCSICKKNIEKAVNKVPGTIDVKVDRDEKVAHVNYDKSKTDLSRIEKAITMAGYDANDKKADPDAYQKLDDCCKLPKDQKEDSQH
jgi:periplasmic mercuric ion binding protein